MSPAGPKMAWKIYAGRLELVETAYKQQPSHAGDVVKLADFGCAALTNPNNKVRVYGSRIYIYIYIYMCVCMCVCVGVKW